MAGVGDGVAGAGAGVGSERSAGLARSPWEGVQILIPVKQEAWKVSPFKQEMVQFTSWERGAVSVFQTARGRVGCQGST